MSSNGIASGKNATLHAKEVTAYMMAVAAERDEKEKREREEAARLAAEADSQARKTAEEAVLPLLQRIDEEIVSAAHELKTEYVFRFFDRADEPFRSTGRWEYYALEYIRDSLNNRGFKCKLIEHTNIGVELVTTIWECSVRWQACSREPKQRREVTTPGTSS